MYIYVCIYIYIYRYIPHQKLLGGGVLTTCPFWINLYQHLRAFEFVHLN